MSFDAREWLEGRLDNGAPNHRRISFLLLANGGKWEVTSWGFIGSIGRHQAGLHEEEAFELMELSGFMMGLRAAGIEIDKIFEPYFDEYVKEFLDEELVQNAEHEPRAVTSRAFDYRGELERLCGAVEQAAAAQFESRAANGVLESAVKRYAEMLPNASTMCGKNHK
jgi:hypothetical protein